MKTKCNFKELIVLVALLFSALFSNMKAQNGVCGDNLTWSFNSETGELTITGTGEMYDYYYFTAPWSPYKANIEKLNIGNGITYIGKYSFNGLMNIQEVTIPNTVEIIGNDSFDNCGSLRIVNIPPSVKKIENAAFGSYAYKHLDEVNIQDLEAWLIINFVSPSSNPAGISKSFKLNGEELTTIVIPEHITELKAFVFYNCSNIENFTTNGQVNGIHDSSLIGTKWYNNQSDGVIYFDKVLYDYKGEMPVSTQIVVKDGIETIAKESFKNEEVLEAITLPNTLKTIEQSAFMSCSGLKMIEFPESLQHIASLAFCGCTSLEGINIPSSIEIIEESAFAECSNLQNIIVNEGNNYYDSRNNCNAIVETLTNKLIRGCLNTIIPENVEVLGESAFSKCIGLKTIKIPNSVKKFEDKVFAKCVDLDSIELSDSLEDMGMHTFSHCSNLKKCVIPNRITAIGGGMFNYCTSLEKVFLPNTIKKVGDFSFTQCSSLKSIDFPSELDSIGMYAFSSCTALEKIVIPDSVTFIGELAFNCKGLKEVTLGKHVINIGDRAFIGCDSLLVINAHMENPKPINQNTFKNYEGVVLNVPIGTKDKYQYTSYWSKFSTINEIFDDIENIDIEVDGLTYYLSYADNEAYLVDGSMAVGDVVIPEEIVYEGDIFKVTKITRKGFYQNVNITGIKIGDNVKRIESNMFNGCVNLSNVDISNSVEYFGQFCFAKCNKLTTIIIPNETAKLDFSSFEDCVNLETVVLPKKLTVLGTGLFSGCTKLKNIELPESVTEIGDFAFFGCTSLQEIILGENITKVGYYIISNCTALKTITFNAKNYDISGAFSDQILLNGCTSLEEIRIGKGVLSIPNFIFDESVEKLKLSFNSENNCSINFRNIITELEIGDNVTDVKDYMFIESGKLVKLTISNNVKTLGKYSFYQCANLEQVILGDGLERIDEYAFSGCSKLKNIDFGKNLISIGNNSFSECSSLVAVKWNNDLKSIGDYAFSNCSSLENLEVIDCLEQIGQYSFNNCKNLKTVQFGASLRKIEDYSFNYCSALANVVIPNSVDTIGISFPNCSNLDTLTIGEGVKEINAGAFSNCSLKAISFNAIDAELLYKDSNRRKYYALAGTANTIEVNIGENVSVLNDYAFYSCNNLQIVKCYAMIPPMCVSTVFANVDKSTCKIYVPVGTLELYRNADVWKDFVNILEISSLGVEDLVEDDTPIEYYDLNGIKVNNPSNGVFIMKQGTKANKVIVK